MQDLYQLINRLCRRLFFLGMTKLMFAACQFLALDMGKSSSESKPQRSVVRIFDVFIMSISAKGRKGIRELLPAMNQAGRSLRLDLAAVVLVLEIALSCITFPDAEFAMIAGAVT